MKTINYVLMALISIILISTFNYMSDQSTPQTSFHKVIDENISYVGYHLKETRKRVVIIDSGLDYRLLTKDYMCKDIAIVSNKSDYGPWSTHGTTVTSIVNLNMDKSSFCITMVISDESQISQGVPFYAYKVVNRLKSVYVVNMSYRWPLYNNTDYLNIKKAIEKGIRFVAAAGNESVDIGSVCMIYPACYAKLLEKERNESFTRQPSNQYRHFFTIVGAPEQYSNYGSIVDIYVEGDPLPDKRIHGTSMSTALYTGYLTSQEN